MKIHCLSSIYHDSNIYVILGAKPTVIDCGTGMYHDEVAARITKVIDPAEIKQIIITHEHFDHCGGVEKLFNLSEENAKIFCHQNAAEKIEQGKSDFAKMLGGEMPKMPVDVKLKEGDAVKIGDEIFDVLHTPGHSPGCMCLYSKASKSLISGDTIFSYGSFGRYDFPGGNGKELRKSIERLAELDVENLYPGHDATVEGNANEHLAMTLKNSSYLM